VPFDIHAGATDLIFPHHENEIAQSEGATGKLFARFWMHVGFITLNREKMSKSVGNVLPLKDVVDRVEPAALRLVFAQTHYRSPFDWSDEQEKQAAGTLATLKRNLLFEEDLGAQAVLGEIKNAVPENPPEMQDLADALAARFLAFQSYMDDDLGTPRALAELIAGSRQFAGFRQANPKLMSRPGILARLRELRLNSLANLEVLGLPPFLGFSVPEELNGIIGERPEEIDRLVEEREKARKAKDWARADALRKELKDKGWLLEDAAQGTVVRRA
jgi:cysteinyl-tRNA synthetase